jgi:hypothetical protein
MADSNSEKILKLNTAKSVLKAVFDNMTMTNIENAIPYLNLIKNTATYYINNVKIDNKDLTNKTELLSLTNGSVNLTNDHHYRTALTELKSSVNDNSIQQQQGGGDYDENLELTETLDTETRYEKNLYQDYKQKYKLLKQKLKNN